MRIEKQEIKVCGIVICIIWFCAILFASGGCSSIKPSKPTSTPGSAKEYAKPKPKPYRVGNTWYQPIHDSKGFSQEGIASWYGADFHGKRTSNGEIYDMHAMTAAHKTLPLGTYVRIHNLENNRTIDLRINDRGPFVRGRIVDLSYAAAKELGIVEKGTARVKLIALGTVSSDVKQGDTPRYVPGDYYSGNFSFQIGAFLDRSNAERLKKELDHSYKNVRILTYNNGDQTFYRVRIGRYTSLEKIIEEEPLIQERFADEFVVAE